MLFNSIEFLVLFLPLAVTVFYLLRAFQPAWILHWLTLSSLFFYAWWEPRYLVLLLSSAAVNYLLARAMVDSAGELARKSLFVLGLVWNLGLLGFYKYAAFIVTNVALALDWHMQAPSIVLPLAISFFTFQQIAYLADVRSGHQAEQSPLRYLLFVTFFPQLIAGPIVHHKQMLPQFARLSQRVDPALLAPAITLIVLGLAKKVLVADSLALFAIPGFDTATAQQQLLTAEAWLSISAYTLQIYFDFSGYCDIAMGCALLIGIRLPINFMSPYKSASISEYWRRWHMTLSQFMRDYIYIPMGGNRKGNARQFLNLFSTAAVSGLWHGAGWTYVLWGCIHGSLLVLNHQWRRSTKRFSILDESRLWHVFCVFLTFMVVLLAFVYFRSPDLETAHYFFSSMFHYQALADKSAYLTALQSGVRGDVLDYLMEQGGVWPVAGSLLLLSLFIVFALPNALQIIGQEKWGFEAVDKYTSKPLLAVQWQPNIAWAVLVGLLLLAVLMSLTSVSPFLYFQF